MSRQGRYRCIHCGDFFDDPEYEEMADCGYATFYPDTCEECCDMINHPVHEPCPSDADPGL